MSIHQYLKGNHTDKPATMKEGEASWLCYPKLGAPWVAPVQSFPCWTLPCALATCIVVEMV